MQYIRKTLLLLSITFLFISFSKNSWAQYPGMAAVRAEQNKQFINQQTQMMMTNMNWRSGAGKGSRYLVKLKDSTIKEVTSYMYTDTILHKNFLVYVNKKFPKSDTVYRNQKIYADQTIYISTQSTYESQDEIYGTPNDTCWMFKVLKGPLTVYAKKASFLISDGGFGEEIDATAIVGIQLNDGPIEMYSKKNLRKMIGSDPKALENIKKQSFFDAIRRYNHDNGKFAKK